MKTTVKEYQTKLEERKTARNGAENYNYSGNIIESIKLKDVVNKLNETYFSKLETVSVSFMCGSRLFYENVIKIGKTYFNNGRKMTKSNGYYCIKELQEITEEMNQSMIADSYYY